MTHLREQLSSLQGILAFLLVALALFMRTGAQSEGANGWRSTSSR